MRYFLVFLMGLTVGMLTPIKSGLMFSKDTTENFTVEKGNDFEAAIVIQGKLVTCRAIVNEYAQKYGSSIKNKFNGGLLYYEKDYEKN